MNGRTLGLLMLACLVLIGLHAQITRPAMEGPFPAQGGEICVVCYAPVLAGDLVYLINGRRYAVDRMDQAHFLENPQTYVDKFDRYQAAQRRKMLLPIGLGAVVLSIGVVFFLRRRK